jgi:scyllo-inositol 2-dehydrogenase (NADP+)
MQKIQIAIIGAGNISNTRHIPALKKMKNVEIAGVIGVRSKNVERTMLKHKITNSLVITKGTFYENMKNCEWFNSIDAVVIGAPPKEHYPMVESSLMNNKHVLVEKPMTMDENEADKLIDLAKKKKKQICVMHNFQFASGLQKLEKKIYSGELGDLVSFYEFQLTNKHRRLPEWYNDLPLGLFFDEAPHFMYLLERFGGPLAINESFAHPSFLKEDNTPLLLSVSLRAGKYPANIFLNFESPICEWCFVVCGDKKIAFYDLFKDILIVLPTDNEHYALDILRTSWRATYQYWVGFIKNGFKMMSGNLLYGHEVVMQKFIDSIITGSDIDSSINGLAGKRTVGYMQSIVDNVKER